MKQIRKEVMQMREAIFEPNTETVSNSESDGNMNEETKNELKKSKEKSYFSAHSIVLCALFSALIAAGAFIKIPVPAVPFTLQFLFTTLAGLLLGKKYGAIAVTVYIMVGLTGIPVFTSGGGIGYIFQPTFGYIIGFLAGTYVTGMITEKFSGTFKTYLFAGFAGLLVVYAFGIVYYYFISNYYLGSAITVKTLLIYGFVLAVPGDIAICYVSAMAAKRIKPFMKAGIR